VEPEILYARLGNDRIAYQVLGEGPVDLVASLGIFAALDAQWADPEAAAAYARLSAHCRLIMFDRMGTGASDPVPLDSLPPLEARWDEIRAVMDAAGSTRAVLFGMQEGGPPAMFGAATDPDRVAGLILLHSPARYVIDDDYSIGFDEETVSQWSEVMEAWDVDTMIKTSFPSRADDGRFLIWGRRLMRALAAPGAMLAYSEAMVRTDVRDLLPSIQVPTLVLHRRENRWVPVEFDRYVADHIEGARFVELPGGDSAIYFEAVDVVVKTIADFLADIDPTVRGRAGAERLMATVLLTDIVDSTVRAQEVGDTEWSHLLQLHDDLSSNLVEEQGGRVVKTTGDGVLAVFDGPGRGLLAAAALSAALERVGLSIRAGLHTGEAVLREDDLGGIAVHLAARVMAEAGAGEVLVSRTVRDLVAGSDFNFEDRGSHALKGIEGDWQLFALTPS